MQADGRTPVAAGRKKRQTQTSGATQQEDGDEDGEMSMELDDSTVLYYLHHPLSDWYVGTASPSTYFAHTRNPPSPSTRRLGQSSSQPVPRTSDVDFDSVPSPRRSKQSRVLRQSNGAGPSNLSKSIVAFDDEEQDGGVDDNGFDDYDPPGNDISPDIHAASQRTPRRTSFSAMDQDDDEDEEETITPRQAFSVARENDHSNSRDLNGTGKGKGKARVPSSPSPAVPASDDLPPLPGGC